MFTARVDLSSNPSSCSHVWMIQLLRLVPCPDSLFLCRKTKKKKQKQQQHNKTIRKGKVWRLCHDHKFSFCQRFSGHLIVELLLSCVMYAKVYRIGCICALTNRYTNPIIHFIDEMWISKAITQLSILAARDVERTRSGEDERGRTKCMIHLWSLKHLSWEEIITLSLHSVHSFRWRRDGERFAVAGVAHMVILLADNLLPCHNDICMIDWEKGSNRHSSKNLSPFHRLVAWTFGIGFVSLFSSSHIETSLTSRPIFKQLPIRKGSCALIDTPPWWCFVIFNIFDCHSFFLLLTLFLLSFSFPFPFFLFFVFVWDDVP